MQKKPHGHHGRHHHPIHSGDTAPACCGGDTIEHHVHHHPVEARQDAYQTCMAAIRGLDSDEKRVALLSRLLSASRHETLIAGFGQIMLRAMQAVDDYSHPPEQRPF